MPKFLIKASYNPDGVRGLLKEGGSKRRAVVQKLIEGMGGKLEAFYYAWARRCGDHRGFAGRGKWRGTEPDGQRDWSRSPLDHAFDLTGRNRRGEQEDRQVHRRPGIRRQAAPSHSTFGSLDPARLKSKTRLTQVE